MDINKLKPLSAGAPGSKPPSADAELLVAGVLPSLPTVTATELSNANDWLMARGLLWHPRVAFLSPVARMGLARIASRSKERARQLLDSLSIKTMRFLPSRRQDGLSIILELTEVLARRNIAIGRYMSNLGLLNMNSSVLRGTLTEMLHVAELASVEGNQGFAVSARTRRGVPWDNIPTSFLNSLNKIYPELAGLNIGFGTSEPITEIDAVVLGDRLVEIKLRGDGQSMDATSEENRYSGAHHRLLNPAKLMAIAKKEHLRGVEYALYMSAVGDEWGSTIIGLASSMEVGLRILLYPNGLGEPEVYFDSMGQRQAKGASMLFGAPPLMPLPKQGDVLSVEERAWLSQWATDPKDRAKAVQRSRHFIRETLPKHAGAIAAGLVRALETHYGPLAIFHLFDGTDAYRLFKQADFLAKQAGRNSTEAMLEHLISIGLEIKEITEGDDELARTLARLAGYSLRDPGALMGLGISESALLKIEEFIETGIPSWARERYLIESAGKDSPLKLFNLHRLLHERRSEIPDELAREIERALPERAEEVESLYGRFVKLDSRYRELPWEHEKGLVKTHRQKLPKMIRRARAERSGDLGLIEARLDEFEEELNRIEAQIASSKGMERRIGGIVRSSDKSEGNRDLNFDADEAREAALIDADNATSANNSAEVAIKAGAFAGNSAAAEMVSGSSLKPVR